MSAVNTNYYSVLRKIFNEWENSEDFKKHKFSYFLSLTPDLFFLLCKLLVDSDLQRNEKSKIANAIAYFASPEDLIPEADEGPAGFVDDLVITAIVLYSLIDKGKSNLINRHWNKKEIDIIKIIKDIINSAEELVGKDILEKIINRMNQFNTK